MSYISPVSEAEKRPNIITADAQPYEIPEEGSLGLLALGYRGLIAWRSKRAERMMGDPVGRAGTEVGIKADEKTKDRGKPGS